MKVSRMRVLDFYLGAAMCLLLSIFNSITQPIRWVISLFAKRDKEIRVILVMKYFGLGSIVLSSPMIKALRGKFPQAKILFLTFYGNKEVIQLYHLADDILTIRTGNICLFSFDVIKNILICWHKGVDIAIDLEFFAKFSTIMTYLSGAHTRVGFYLRQMWRGNLLTHHGYYNSYHHVREIFLFLAQTLGADTNDLSVYKPSINPQDTEFVENLLTKNNILPQEKIICVNPNVSDLCVERRWPAANFASLIYKIYSNAGCKIIIIGSNEDTRYSDTLINLLEAKQGAVNFTGKLSLGQLLALFRRAHLLITNDSGPLHLAVSVNTPTVSFFGPETPVLYRPIGCDHLIFYKNLYCSPCLNVYNLKTAMYGDKRCFEGANKCMQAISVDEVYEQIREQFIKKWQG